MSTGRHRNGDHEVTEMYYDHGFDGWDWMEMPVTVVLFWAVLITVIVLVARSMTERERVLSASTSEQLLAERFACGEIDEDECWQRLQMLPTADRVTPS